MVILFFYGLLVQLYFFLCNVLCCFYYVCIYQVLTVLHLFGNKYVISVLSYLLIFLFYSCINSYQIKLIIYFISKN